MMRGNSKGRAIGGRGPILHDDTVRHVDEGQAGGGFGCQPTGGRESRGHGIQRGQGDGSTQSSKKGSPWEALSRDHRSPPLLSNAVKLVTISPLPIWKGMLSTMPRIRLENRYCPSRHFITDLLDGGPVVALQTASQRVGQHLFGKAVCEGIRVVPEDGLELFRPGEGAAIRERAGGVHRELALVGTPAADGIVIFKRKTQADPCGHGRKRRPAWSGAARIAGAPCREY